MATLVATRRKNPIAARRRYVRQTGYLILAIAVAIYGQGFIANRDGRSEFPAVILIGIGVLLTTLIGGDLDVDAPIPSPMNAAELPASGWRWPVRLRQPRVWIPLAVTVGCLWVSLFIFERVEGIALNLAWLAYLASMIVGVFAAFRLDVKRPSGKPTWLRRDWVALGAILLVAAFFRLIHPDQPWGLWFDEAAHGLDVSHLLADPTFRPIYLQTIVPEPALHWYFDAIFFALFGPSIFSLRISAVLAGLVCVTGIFFLARYLFGWRTGVVAGAFLAVAVWNVDFSRIMFNAIWSVALNSLAAYFLVKGFNENRYRYFAFGGFFLGLGLNNYYTSRLFVAVAAIYVVYRFVLEPRNFLKRWLAGIAVFGAFTILSGGPLIEFALLHSNEFNARVAEVSVFGEIAQQHSLDPLWSNLQRHALMFNYIGDPNGRHNLSGSPELDQAMAALFVLGLALAIRRVRDHRYALPLIWFPVVLAGGIFSLSFEAPQSLRTIDNSLVSVLFASIPIGALWARLSWARLGSVAIPPYLGRPPVVTVGGVLAIGVMVWAATLNYNRYFVQQATDFRSWVEFSVAESEVGREISTINLSTTSVYVAGQYLGQPTIDFFAPAYHEQLFDPTQNLPLHDVRDVAIFLPDVDEQTVVNLERYYPQAVVKGFGPPFGGPIVLYSVRISAAEIAAVQGITGSYTPVSTAASPAHVIKDASVNFDWSKTAPPVAIPFDVVWQGVLSAPQYGTYQLKLQGPTQSELFVDENSIAKGNQEQTILLAAGTHTLRLTASVTQPGPVQLLWRTPTSSLFAPVPTDSLFVPPVTSRGLIGKYYTGGNWQGTPALEQIDPAMDQHFHMTPLPRPYSVEWDGKIDIPSAGIYTFGTQAIDASWVYLDNQLIATNQGQPDTYIQGAARLTEGLHDIKIKFQDLSGFSYVTVSWQPPGMQREVLPPDRLFPPQGAYPDRAGPLKSSIPKVIATTGSAQPVGLPQQPAPPVPAQAAPPAPAAPEAPAVGALPVSTLHQLRAFGEPGTGPGQFKGARGIAVDPQGNVYVVDTGNFRVNKFGKDGKFILSFGAQGDSTDQFQEPVDVAIDSTGRVIVLDSTTAWLKVFTPDGKYASEFGGPALAAYHPRSLAIAVTGEIYVADAGGSRVVRLKPTGDLDQALGTKGPGEGQLMEPVGVAVAPDDSVYVVDTGSNRLSHFDATFHLIKSWRIPKSTSVIGPKILIAADGTIYVSDPEGHRVIHYDANGNAVDQIGASGELQRPMGLALDRQGDIYIADADSNRVVIYGPGVVVT